MAVNHTEANPLQILHSLHNLNRDAMSPSLSKLEPDRSSKDAPGIIGPSPPQSLLPTHTLKQLHAPVRRAPIHPETAPSRVLGYGSRQRNSLAETPAARGVEQGFELGDVVSFSW